MNAESLLAELKQVGVDLTAAGDDLVVNAPAGIITEEWREKLITSKQDLLALLVPQEDKDPLLNGDRDIESEHSPSTDEPPCWVLETEDVYDRVQRAGVNIWLDAAGTLRIDKTAPEEIKQMVRGHKQDLIDFFAWSEAKAKKLNRIFEEQGATGTRSTITGATVRHGAVKRWLKSKANKSSTEPSPTEETGHARHVGVETAETGWAHTVLGSVGVRLMELDGVFTVGIWSDLDSAKLRAALAIFGSDTALVRYLDGVGIPDRYKLRRVPGKSVPLEVLAALERNSLEPWVVRDRMLAAVNEVDVPPESDLKPCFETEKGA